MVEAWGIDLVTLKNEDLAHFLKNPNEPKSFKNTMSEVSPNRMLISGPEAVSLDSALSPCSHGRPGDPRDARHCVSSAAGIDI